MSRPRRGRARTGRYHLADPYSRFYFRFVAPYQDELAYKPEKVLPRIHDGLRSFVGSTALVELSCQWIAMQGQAGNLPFEIEEISAHWSRTAQVDAVALNWTEHKILLGECKWGVDPVRRSGIRELIESKAPNVLRDLPPRSNVWQVHYAFFGRRRHEQVHLVRHHHTGKHPKLVPTALSSGNAPKIDGRHALAQLPHVLII